MLVYGSSQGSDGVNGFCRPLEIAMFLSHGNNSNTLNEGFIRLHDTCERSWQLLQIRHTEEETDSVYTVKSLTFAVIEILHVGSNQGVAKISHRCHVALWTLPLWCCHKLLLKVKENVQLYILIPVSVITDLIQLKSVSYVNFMTGHICWNSPLCRSVKSQKCSVVPTKYSIKCLALSCINDYSTCHKADISTVSCHKAVITTTSIQITGIFLLTPNLSESSQQKHS